MWDRFDATAALEHPVRQAIVDLAREQPGVHLAGLHSRMKSVSGRSSFGYGSLAYHLRRLERVGLLTSRRSGRHRRYYPVGSGLTDLAAAAVIQRPRTLQVARFVVQEREATSNLIAERLDVARPCSRQVACYHLGLLKKANLVVEVRNGRKGIYLPTARLTALVAKLANDPPAFLEIPAEVRLVSSDSTSKGLPAKGSFGESRFPTRSDDSTLPQREGVPS